MSSRTKSILYWTTTAIIVFVWLSGGIADLIRRPATAEGVIALGYPAYVLTILGVWKVLGAIAIAVPGFPRLKEWAYAGTFFELSGALASHAWSGSTVNHFVWPGFFLVCSVASWALRPPGRVLGTLFPASVWQQLTHPQLHLHRRTAEPAEPAAVS
ncbi:MAG TPA: DoxX family protein [Actinophytocola sp.]|uniref:DoxX family protein n=1 Tax=Actinophytocola sp. TaxID=1872138 RepID=UPI002DDD6E19|nr:DoxX family protein [Actinophytocola sp.]HEV2778336.1 DoxX family protein [Actinophytocola sp.]